MRRMTLPDGCDVFHVNRRETTYLHNEIFARQIYVRHGIVVDHRSTVFDVGANVGMFAVFLARRHPGIQVLAFEPVPALSEVLRANVALHRVRGGAFGCALGAHGGEADIVYYPHNTLLSGLHVDPADNRRAALHFMAQRAGHTPVAPSSGEAPLPAEIGGLLDGLFQSQTIRVPVRTVSAVMAEQDVARVDLLKIDVEKAECDVLAGVRDEDWARVEQVVVEVHDHAGRLSAIVADLGRRGFHVVTERETESSAPDVHLAYARRGPR